MVYALAVPDVPIVPAKPPDWPLSSIVASVTVPLVEFASMYEGVLMSVPLPTELSTVMFWSYCVAVVAGFSSK